MKPFARARALLLGALITLTALAGSARAQGSPRPDRSSLEALSRAFERAAERTLPCVVAIDVGRDAAAEVAEAGRPYYARRPQGSVSAVAVGPRRLLTSAWNLEGGRTFTAIRTGGERIELALLGRDERLDLALLETRAGDASPFTPVDLSRAGTPRVGAFLVAAGRGPTGDAVVNTGIASALSRMGGAAIETDVALDYANYGGAVADIDGVFVGVAVRLFERAGINSGVGFVVPVARIREALPALERGELRAAAPQAFLGVSFGRELEPSGVELASVEPGSAAALGGLEKGDILKRIGDIDIADAAAAADAIHARKPLELVHVEVERGGRGIGFEVVLGSRNRK